MFEEDIQTLSDFKLSSRSRDSRIITIYMLCVSVAFLIASIVAVIVTKEKDFVENLFRILTSPSKLVTDYFALGGLGSSFFNAAVCGFIANIIIYFSRVKTNATTFAAYMLVVAHCFYGLNFLNMMPFIVGVVLFCGVTKKSFAENVHISLFATALAPFVSDFMFRYTSALSFELFGASISFFGIIMSVLFALASGFIVPALLPGTTAMHRGYNMYKAGLAIGIMGIFVYCFLYATFGFDAPTVIEINNPEYYKMPYGYRSFMNGFFAILFLLTGVAGFVLNGCSFKGYRDLLKCTGYGTDFHDKFGVPICLINVCVYGSFLVAVFNIFAILPEIFPAIPAGAGFTGATVGVVFAGLTFSLDGQQPRIVFPIVIGYILLFMVVCVICVIGGMDIPWNLSTQGYINGLAFATGLCPFAGKYGYKIGILAGFLSAVICTSTAAMHGGFVLYNGGFTAGLTALVLIPILDYYKIMPKYDDDTHHN
ncbi:MAG: DUF1576 domain-containing protein [Ruminococcaceae bacterium]|nr:DUF1576 domain-containing protein [Oscillospiraceae bacterium]